MNKIFKLWAAVVVWCLLIFGLSSIPGLSSGLDYDYLLRKIAHVLEYLILTFLLYRAFKGSFSLDALSLFFYPAMLSFFYAISDEIHQMFVPHRHGALSDVIIDSIGIVGFYLFIQFVKPSFKSS